MADSSVAPALKSSATDREIATLQAREERLRLALSAGRIYTWDWDIAAGTLEWTDGLEKELLLPQTPTDIAAFRSLVHPDDVDLVSRRVEAALNGPHDYEAEFRMVRADGSVRWCAARAIVVRDENGAAVRMVGVDQDITERRELLHRLSESEARLRLAMQAAGAGAWEFRIDDNEFIASDDALALHSIAPGTKVSNDQALAAVHPDDRERVEAALRHTIATGAPFRQEMRAAHADGSERWLLSQAELRMTGRRTSLIGLAQDITRQKTLEAEIVAARERFAVALGNSPTAVFEQDLDLRYTWVFNPKLGYSVEQFLGKTDAEMMSAATAATVEALKRDVIASGVSVRRRVPVAAPGEAEDFYDLHVKPRRDGGGRIVGVICAATDVTAMKKAEDALRDSEARYRTALAVGRMASWETDYQSGVRRWSPEGLALFGLDLVDGVGAAGGKRDEFRDALHPEDRHLHQRFRDQEKAQDSFSAKYRIVLPDGRIRWMSGHARVAERNAQGEPLRIVNVATDVTERWESEENARYLLHELSHRSKNILAVVQGVVTLSSRNADSVKELSSVISGRLAALSESNSLLTGDTWQGARLGDLVARQLGTFFEMPNEQVVIEGPDVTLIAHAVQSIGLALHELTTNALKYGALSIPEGRVGVNWRLEAEASEPVLALEWIERGGPPVSAPQRKGFGQVVMKQMIEQALSAKVDLEYAPQGVRWRARAPASKVVGAFDQAP